ncbi:hypothetical protein UlMin_044182 [Ulmus minor]
MFSIFPYKPTNIIKISQLLTIQQPNIIRINCDCLLHTSSVLELDRQEKKSEENALAPKWWISFKYKLPQTLIDEKDDDLRLFAWESLKSSVGFKVALEALKLVAERYGSSNVCVAGHSLGAGFALQVGKTLAKEGIYVD